MDINNILEVIRIRIEIEKSILVWIRIRIRIKNSDILSLIRITIWIYKTTISVWIKNSNGIK